MCCSIWFVVWTFFFIDKNINGDWLLICHQSSDIAGKKCLNSQKSHYQRKLNSYDRHWWGNLPDYHVITVEIHGMIFDKIRWWLFSLFIYYWSVQLVNSQIIHFRFPLQVVWDQRQIKEYLTWQLFRILTRTE